MTANERAQERNAKLLEDLKELNKIFKSTTNYKKNLKSEFNMIKVYESLFCLENSENFYIKQFNILEQLLVDGQVRISNMAI